MAPLKILIIGGGITGNALAYWLSKAGHDITVVERFANLRTAGLQIDLRGHGIEVLKRMGLDDDFRSLSISEQGLQFVDSSGRRRAYFPANKSGKGVQSFTSEYEIMRGDLVRILYDSCKSRVKHLFETTVESFEESNDGSFVEARLSNGQTDRFDLLIGADGQWSRTRRMMLGPDAPDAIHLIKGMCVSYFTMPQPKEANEESLATIFMSPGSRGVMTRRSNPKELQVYLGCKTKSGPMQKVRRGDIKAEKEAIAEMFEGAGWKTDELVTGMKNADNFYCERVGLIKLDSWSKGRVAVVGDAAYCPSLNTGMGTTSGMVGAYVLAGEITKHFGSSTKEEKEHNGNNRGRVVAALESYERIFRPFMDQVQKGVEEDDGPWPETSLGITFFNCLAGLASFFKVNIAKYFLKEGVGKDWHLPEYEEMLRN